MALLRMPQSPEGMTARTYRSLFLDEENPHQRYFGWRVEEDAPGLRVLRRRYGPFSRSLLLLGAAGREALPDAVRRAAGRLHCADVMVHDFDEVLAQPVVVDSLRFHRASATERLLNIATFVIDITRDDIALQAAMSTDYRRKLRKAEAAGFKLEVHEQPAPGLIDEFLCAYTVMAEQKGLAGVRREPLCRMYEDGHALLLLSRRRGEVRNFLHLYMTQETGLFMYGVNLAKENDGSGQFIHWQAMLELRRRGRVWYDLGGVPVVDASNGIFQFKVKFGGQLVTLGSEWCHTGRAVKQLTAALRLIRRTQRAVGHR